MTHGVETRVTKYGVSLTIAAHLNYIPVSTLLPLTAKTSYRQRSPSHHRHVAIVRTA